MPNVFDYTDFHAYLEDYYNEGKALHSTFCYQVIAAKAGFNKGFVYNIFNGKKKLSRINCFKLSQGLRHNKTEADYFENLVAFNQASGLEEKNHFYETMSQLSARGKGFTQAQTVRKEQYEFYSVWYHSAIRSIVGMYEFKGDYKWLARMVVPEITEGQARKSMALLKRLGMVTVQKNGACKISSPSITTGKEVIGLAVGNFHIECTELAKRAILKYGDDDRSITSLTLGISKAAYDRIREETALFQEKVMAIANSDGKADSVYQYNFHLFPISKSDAGRKVYL